MGIQMSNPISHLVAVQMLGKGSEARVVTVLGTRVLFSYEVPVGFRTADQNVGVVLDTKHSRTTSKHIKTWLDLEDVRYIKVDADLFPGLLRSELTKALKETPK